MTEERLLSVLVSLRKGGLTSHPKDLNYARGFNGIDHADQAAVM
ncbi:hypothetical protein BH23GEM8_BH23GEM8_01230 [soil metagenome]